MIQNSDGLRVLVGDGEEVESFSALRGMTVSRLEITQQLHMADAVGEGAWQTGVGTSQRHAVIECAALASDEAPAGRLRALALSGVGGTMRLELAGDEAFEFVAYVTRYREVTQPGQVKRFECRLESAGAASVVAL